VLNTLIRAVSSLARGKGNTIGAGLVIVWGVLAGGCWGWDGVVRRKMMVRSR